MFRREGCRRKGTRKIGKKGKRWERRPLNPVKFSVFLH